MRGRRNVIVLNSIVKLNCQSEHDRYDAVLNWGRLEINVSKLVPIYWFICTSNCMWNIGRSRFVYIMDGWRHIGWGLCTFLASFSLFCFAKTHTNFIVCVVQYILQQFVNNFKSQSWLFTAILNFHDGSSFSTPYWYPILLLK